MAIVSLLHHDPAHCYARSCYEYQVNSLLTLHRSLHRVGTQLPIHVLLSGWHDHPRVEDAVRAIGPVTIHRAHTSIQPPNWAVEWHRGTFAKLLVLNLSQQLDTRVLFLDGDILAMRSIDHLQHALLNHAAAFCTKPWEGINGGVMLLDARRGVPGALDVEDAWRFFAQLTRNRPARRASRNAHTYILRAHRR